MISLTASEILTFPIPKRNSGTSIPFFVPAPEPLPTYTAPIFSPLISKSLPSPQLKINPLYAILIGSAVDAIPGVGTFYDFFVRLWYSDDDNLSSHLRPAKVSVKKPVRKGDKTASIDKLTMERLLKELEVVSISIEEQPFASLFELYHKEFLLQYIKKELINSSSLSIAGDGTPVVTSTRERNTVAATVLPMALPLVTAHVTFHSRTAILAEIPQGNVFTSVMICTCLLLPIAKATCRSFLCSDLPPAMIHTISSMPTLT